MRTFPPLVFKAGTSHAVSSFKAGKRLCRANLTATFLSTESLASRVSGPDPLSTSVSDAIPSGWKTQSRQTRYRFGPSSHQTIEIQSPARQKKEYPDWKGDDTMLTGEHRLAIVAAVALPTAIAHHSLLRDNSQMSTLSDDDSDEHDQCLTLHQDFGFRHYTRTSLAQAGKPDCGRECQ